MPPHNHARHLLRQAARLTLLVLIFGVIGGVIGFGVGWLIVELLGVLG